MTEKNKNQQYNSQNPQNQEEDDDQRFIKKNQENQEAVEESQENQEEGQEENQENQGVRPESNQQRNLDREVGGLEAKDIPQQIIEEVVDFWDNQASLINEEAQDSSEEISNPDTSSMRKLMIHKKKQEVKLRKKIKEQDLEEGEEMESYAEKIMKAREEASHSNGGRGL